jgi:hypothetical protein
MKGKPASGTEAGLFGNAAKQDCRKVDAGFRLKSCEIIGISASFALVRQRKPA